MKAIKYIPTPLGQLQPGDAIYEKTRSKARPYRNIGIVASVEKQPEHRSVLVHLVGGSGFSQNWAAKLLVRKAG